MPQTRSGRSTENFTRSLGSSAPSPPLSSLEAALPPPPQSAPQYTSLQTSCTTSQQAFQVDPTTLPSSPLTSDMDIDPDSSVKSLIGTLVHHLQLITQSLQEPRTIIWYNELRGANAPIFIGAPDPVAAEHWIKVMEKLYRAMEVPHDKWVKLAVPFLLGKAGMWFETIEALYGQIHDWATFKDHFYKNYLPMPVRNQKIKEFVNLKQGNMTVLEYAHKFFELGKFVPDVMEDELLKIGKFEEGFNFVIKSGLSGQRANDFSDLLEKAIRAENIGNIFSQTTAGVTQTIESDTVTVSAPVNKKPAVTTITFPPCQKCNKHHSGECRIQLCYQCGQKGHLRNDCKLGQTQTSAPTDAHLKEFVNFKQGSMTVTEYAKKFLEPGKFSPDVMKNELMKRFEDGFNFSIKSGLFGHRANDFCDLLEKAIRVENGVKKTIESDNKKPAVTTLITPQWCRRCGELGHGRKSCPRRGQTQTSAQTPSPASAQTPSQTSMQDRACFLCGQMGHVRNSCPNRDPNAQSTSQDAPRRGKRKCPGRDVTWTAGSEEVDETKPTDNGTELSLNPEAAIIHPPEAAILHPPDAAIIHPPEAATIHPPEAAIINLQSLLEDVKSGSS